MSADNWTTCPRCKDKHEANLSAMFAKVGEAYGTVPVAEFDAMRAEYDAARFTPLPANFREDYSFTGADEGEIVADYSGKCTVCGLTARMEHTVRFYPEG